MYADCSKSKFPYSVKNQKSTLKMLKKLYFIPSEYIIFSHNRQKDLSIYHTSRLTFVCWLVELRAQIWESILCQSLDFIIIVVHYRFLLS